MKTFILLAMAMSFTAQAGSVSYPCHPEIGRGTEVVTVKLDFAGKTGSVVVNGKVVCAGKTKGDVIEYGQSTLTITCANGKKVTFNRDYDETNLKLASLNLGLSDTTYMCE